MFKKSPTSPRPYPLKYPDKTSRAWDYYKNADAIYQRRMNYFLVAESMLLFSFVTVFKRVINEIQYLIVFVGIVVTFCWFYINARIANRADTLKRKHLIPNDPIYWDYIKSVNSIREGTFSTYILPDSILFLWFYLLLYLIHPFGEIILKIFFAFVICIGFSIIVHSLTSQNF